MGQTSAKAKVESITSSLLDVMATATAKQGQTISGANMINIQGCDIDTLDIRQNMYTKVDTTVLQNVSSNVEISNDLEQEIENIVESQSVNIDLSGGNKAESFTKLVTTLSTRLQNEVGAECAQDANTTNAFTCTESNIKNAYIEQEYMATFLFNCTQNVDSVISAKNELETFIKANTKAETKDVIFAILMAIAAIIVLIIIAALLLPVIKSSLAKSPPPPQIQLMP